jgi:hypothetical protein
MSIAGNECILDLSEAFRSQMQNKDILCSRQVSDISCKFPQVLVIQVYTSYTKQRRKNPNLRRKKRREGRPQEGTQWGEKAERGKKKTVSIPMRRHVKSKLISKSSIDQEIPR